MSIAEVKEASIIGPVACTEAQALLAKYAPGLRGQYNQASGTSSANMALPSVTSAEGASRVPMQQRFVRVFNRHPTAILDFAFGIGAAPALTYAPTSNPGTGSAAAGAPIAPMSYQDFIVPDGATHCAWILDGAASPTAGVVTIWCAEDNVSTYKPS